MDPGNRLEVIDREGWCQNFALQKPIVYIGSDARNDVVLSLHRGEGVAARHLQLVASPSGGSVYQAVNLSSSEVGVGREGDQVLLPRGARDIRDGDHLLVGDFRLVFHLSGGSASPVGPGGRQGTQGAGRTGPRKSQAAIGLKLSLAQAQLDPRFPLEGMLTVQNLGDMPGVQFKLELEGLDPDCYELGPGPILFPNVEKGVHVLLKHPRGPGLPAGPHTIRIRATAPDAYPGQMAMVSKEIEILPYYDHVLHLYAVD